MKKHATCRFATHFVAKRKDEVRSVAPLLRQFAPESCVPFWDQHHSGATKYLCLQYLNYARWTSQQFSCNLPTSCLSRSGAENDDGSSPLSANTHNRLFSCPAAPATHQKVYPRHSPLYDTSGAPSNMPGPTMPTFMLA